MSVSMCARRTLSEIIFLVTKKLWRKHHQKMIYNGFLVTEQGTIVLKTRKVPNLNEKELA